jgi:hypothetical protein
MRNNDLMPIVEDPYRQPYMETNKKQQLKGIIDEIDKLQEGVSTTREAGMVVGPRVLLPNVTEIVERTSDKARSGALLRQIHEVLKDEHVSVEIYWRLGESFAELGITNIDPDLKIAIEYGTRQAEAGFRASQGHYYDTTIHDHMIATYVIESAKRRGSPEKA